MNTVLILDIRIGSYGDIDDIKIDSVNSMIYKFDENLNKVILYYPG